MKTKIAFVCPRSPREVYAGIENYVLNLTKILNKDFEVEIYCTAQHPKENAQLNGVKLFEFKEDKLPIGIHFYSSELITALKKSDANIIHACGYNTMSPLMGLLAKKKKQKLFVTLGSSKSSSSIRNALEKIYFTAIKLMSNKVDCFIALSTFEKKEFEKNLSQNKFRVIPIAHEFKRNKKTQTKRNKKQVLSVGRLVKNKGFHFVIDAFSELVKIEPEYRLVIVGDGPYRKKLEEQAKTLGIFNKINFFGSVGHKEHGKIIKLMQESAVFVFLSSYESQGVVVEEAICEGTPTIVANTSAIKEFAECGLASVFEQNESEKIAKKIVEMSNNFEKYSPTLVQIKKCYLIKNWKEVAIETKNAYSEF